MVSMMTHDNPPRRRGRPPKSDALSSGDRTRLMRQRVRAAGGGTVSLTLGSESLRALRALAKSGQRTALIERLILDAYRKAITGSG